MVIVFASYGSASRNLLSVTTPFRVQEEQLVGLACGRSSSVGLLLTEEEAEGVVKKNSRIIDLIDRYSNTSMILLPGT